MRLRSSLCAALALAITATAQQPAPAVAWPDVVLKYTALDHNGNAVHGITADQLTVKEGNSPAKLVSLSEVGATPASVCIVVDASGSNYENRAVIMDEFHNLRDMLPLQDEVCVVDFSQQAYLDAPLSTDRTALDKAFTFIRFSGGSAVMDAVAKAADYLGKKATFANHIIILLSDGGENASVLKEPQLLNFISWPEGPAVYALVKKSSENGYTEGRLDRERLERWTTVSGGLCIEIGKDDDPHAVIQRLIDGMAARLRLDIETNNPSRDGKLRHVSIQLSDSLRKQKITLVGPKLVRAPQP